MLIITAPAYNSTNHGTRFIKMNYSTRSIVFATVESDCRSSRTEKLVIKSAAVAALFTPARLRLTSYNGKNNGVLLPDVSTHSKSSVDKFV